MDNGSVYEMDVDVVWVVIVSKYEKFIERWLGIRHNARTQTCSGLGWQVKTCETYLL
jgi:hypothetical protein